MSIQSEITRISGAKTNIATSIENKGVVVPSGALISDMPSLIDQITGGIDTSDATATAGDILDGKTAYVNGEKITGNIISKSSSDLTSSNNTVTVPAGYYSSQATKTVGTAKAAATYNTSTSDQSIAAGQYLTGAQTIKAVTTSNISAGNIKSGVNVKVGDANSATRIKNVTGTFTAANTVSSGQTAAAANKILTGYSAWVGGSEVKGNISSKAAATYNTSASDQSIASGQYLSGAQTIKAVTTSNISAGNIKVGVNVKVGDANSAGRIKNITGTFDGFITSRAVIHVIAPSGSTVVFKKGSTTMKTVSSSDALPNNNNSIMRDYYCSVASVDYGSWTITATLGTDTASDTLLINSAKEYDIPLSYGVYLFNNGNQCFAVTGGWVNGPLAAYTYTAVPVSISSTIDYSYSTNKQQSFAITSNKIVLDNGDFIRVRCSFTGKFGIFVIDNNATDWYANSRLATYETRDTSQTVHELPITSHMYGYVLIGGFGQNAVPSANGSITNALIVRA